MTTTKLFTYAFILTMSGSGCAPTISEPASASSASASAKDASGKDASQWERRKLADGIELVVDPNAGPEAQRVAEMIQSEMRARYIGAR